MERHFPFIALTCAWLCLAMLAIQYPLATTFPIGGDASRYILKLLEANDVLQERGLVASVTTFLTNTEYPGAQAIFALSALLPLSWPERFTWWIVLGHMFTATSLALLLNRLAGWR